MILCCKLFFRCFYYIKGGVALQQKLHLLCSLDQNESVEVLK